MFASDSYPRPRSLWKRVRISITLLFWLSVFANTGILIWSYFTTCLYVKLLIVVPTTTTATQSDAFLEITPITESLIHAQLPSTLEIDYTEFNISFNEFTKDFWVGTAYTCALAVFGALYIYPYLKLLIYAIVFFVPLKREYQHRAVFHLNQWNKFMFVPLIAVLIECVSFSFTIDLPSQFLQTHTDMKAEAYPGHGIVINMANLICYYVIDHVLLFIINSKHKHVTRSARVFDIKQDAASSINNDDVNSRRMTFVQQTDLEQHVQRKYASTSYAGICAKAFFVVLVIGNIWLNLEALYTATVRIELQGVIAMFIPDRYVINNVMQTGDTLLHTSLLNDDRAWFVYLIYYTVFVICPCVVCALLAIMWVLPMVNQRFAVHVNSKYLLKLLWFIQSWNALDIYVFCQFGATDHNIKYEAMYLLDNRFPLYCGDQAVVTDIFGEDCLWADARFLYGMFLVGATVLFVWAAMYYTNKIYTTDDYQQDDEHELHAKF